MEKLKPCFKCESKNVAYCTTVGTPKWYSVQCNDCGCEIRFYETKEEATKAWNAGIIKSCPFCEELDNIRSYDKSVLMRNDVRKAKKQIEYKYSIRLTRDAYINGKHMGQLINDRATELNYCPVCGEKTTDESEEKGYWIFHPKGSWEKKDVYECSHCGNFQDDARFFAFCPLCGKEKNLNRTVLRYRDCTVSQSEDNHVTVKSGEGRVMFHEQNNERKSIEDQQKSVDNYFDKTWELLNK